MKKRQEGIHVHEGCHLARGIKVFKCFRCNLIGNNYSNGVSYCSPCREELGICDICGKELGE